MNRITCKISFKEAVFEDDKPVIRGVVLLGAESRNNRIYTPECMKKAVGLYENVQGFVNHPTKAEEKEGIRDVMKLAGKYVNVRYEGGKVRGDFHGLGGDVVAKKFVAVAESMPEIAGLSHCASGQIRKEGKVEIVENIDEVYSVDLVANPATTNGMFENENPEEGEQSMDYKDVTMVGLKESRTDLVEKLIYEGKASRDDEIKKLTEENDALKAKVDEMQVSEALRAKEAIVDKALDDSELPKEAKTDIFREQLLKIEVKDGEKLEEKIDELIADRMTVLSGEKGVKNNVEKKREVKEGKQDAATVARGLKGGSLL